MAWMNYRQTLDRFTHIDAEFVRGMSLLSPDGGKAEVVVRLYPWWEHPLYKAARDRGDDWGFSSWEGGMREVTVRAVRPWAVKLSPRQRVIDWSFAETHPLLWDFEETSTIYVNSPFNPEDLISGLLDLRLPFVRRIDLLPFIDTSTRSTPRGVLFPAHLHRFALQVFERLGVTVFSPHAPAQPAPAVVFLLDDDDYIIAEDFDVDVPEFQHDPSWFQPEDPGRAS